MRLITSCLSSSFTQMVILFGIGIGLAALHFNSGTTTTSSQRKMIADLLAMSEAETADPASAGAAAGTTTAPAPQSANPTGSSLPSQSPQQGTVHPTTSSTSSSPPTPAAPSNQTPATGGAVVNPNGAGSESFQEYVDGIRGLMITLDQARHLYDAGLADPTGATEVYFVDAREEKDYEAGHVPGAYHIPPEAFPNAKVLEAVRYWSAGAAVVVYCSGGNCDASNQVVIQLKNMGREAFRHVFIMHDGFPGWQAMGWQVEKGPPAGQP